jgi:hypothetical protein
MRFGIESRPQPEVKVATTKDGQISGTEALRHLDPSDPVYEALSDSQPNASIVAVKGVFRHIRNLLTGDSDAA